MITALCRIQVPQTSIDVQTEVWQWLKSLIMHTAQHIVGNHNMIWPLLISQSKNIQINSTLTESFDLSMNLVLIVLSYKH